MFRIDARPGIFDGQPDAGARQVLFPLAPSGDGYTGTFNVGVRV
jgi:hypothetical protein